MSADQLQNFVRELDLPANVALPRNSDVGSYRELFSPSQIAALAFIRKAIADLRHPDARNAMLLAWSATLAKLNRTFLSAEGRAESRGGSSIFSIYRYKIAKQPVELPPWKTFEERATNVIAAKMEIDKIIELRHRTVGWRGNFQMYQLDVEELAARYDSQIDYIFTDPPYGAHISYLDLSTLWNCWLESMPTNQAREKELIVGGDLQIAEQTYIERLGKSIESCVAMLKPGRWLSVVFQHWNTAYFDAILSSAAESGADLRAAIPQTGDTIWSMHKKKGNESVLSGELILTFYKTGRPLKKKPSSAYFDIDLAVSKILDDVTSDKLYGETVFNQVVLAAWQEGAISSLKITKSEFNELIAKHGWTYDEGRHHWVRQSTEQNLFRITA